MYVNCLVWAEKFVEKGRFEVPVFSDEWGAGGEGEGASDGVAVRDGARDIVPVVVDMWDLFVAASCTSGFSGDDVARFISFEASCEFEGKYCSVGG